MKEAPVSNSDAISEIDRRAYLSVAVSFGNVDSLNKWGARAATATCPECGATGRMLGGRGTELVLEGFTPLTKGGVKAILATCNKCQEAVTLPY